MDANGAFDEELVKVMFRVFPNNTEEHYANQIVDICIVAQRGKRSFQSYYSLEMRLFTIFIKINFIFRRLRLV